MKFNANASNQKLKTHKHPLYAMLGLMMAGLFAACGTHAPEAGYTAEDVAATDEMAPMTVVLEPEGKEQSSTEEYDQIVEQRFIDAASEPVSTFSIDVDNASYSNVRRFLDDNMLPPADAIRIEEMINYFDYDYPQPQGEHPFALVSEVADCPWKRGNKLVHLGIQGKSLNYNELKPSNLVFLIDASGSMEATNKLPLLKKSLGLLLDQLDETDRVSIVAYAGAAGLVLEPTPASKKRTILKALDRLEAGGSTAGAAGIDLAYSTAASALIADGNNRVILCTDGDFNVGPYSSAELVGMINEKRQSGIYLTICGFGMGTYKDGRMEQISNAGNGNYFYIDNIQEAEKVFVKEMRANLFTIAKDVKIQVQFNPELVAQYRLIGYENRIMANEDFDNDLKDAGELGAGHTVTALYEVVPQQYASNTQLPLDAKGELPQLNPTDLMALRLRYKPIDSDKSLLIETALPDAEVPVVSSTDDFQFAAAVAGFGLLLRKSEHKGDLTYEDVLAMANNSRSNDPNGYREEFIRLVKTAQLLDQE